MLLLTRKEIASLLSLAEYICVIEAFCPHAQGQSPAPDLAHVDGVGGEFHIRAVLERADIVGVRVQAAGRRSPITTLPGGGYLQGSRIEILERLRTEEEEARRVYEKPLEN